MGALPGPLPPIGSEADPGVELLERALGYTRVQLATVTAAHLCDPTPCDLWRLADLLGHMEDSLDAFAEGATGSVALRSVAPSPLPERLASLQAKACGLLGAWAAAPTRSVEVGGRRVPVGVIARVAALEVAVHGWDVGRATGRGSPFPDRLAGDLLPFAESVVAGPDAAERFADPVPVADGAPAGARLLALLGRRAGPA